LLLAASSFLTPALAAEIEVGSAVVCDRGDQAERYAALFKGDSGQAIMQVNTESQSENACGMAAIAFRRGDDVARVSSDEGTYIVSRILIAGVLTPGGVQATAPFVQFTVFKIEEQTA
jgi:hypothetical protein